MKYEFRNANGERCCSSDKLEYLCDECKARATGRSGTARTASLRTAIPPERKTAGEWRDEMGRRVQGYGTVVTDTPDPYAEATQQAPETVCPRMDPDYAPHGRPPDPYAIALAIDAIKKEQGS